MQSFRLTRTEIAMFSTNHGHSNVWCMWSTGIRLLIYRLSYSRLWNSNNDFPACWWVHFSSPLTCELPCLFLQDSSKYRFIDDLVVFLKIDCRALALIRRKTCQHHRNVGRRGTRRRQFSDSYIFTGSTLWCNSRYYRHSSKKEFFVRCRW